MSRQTPAAVGRIKDRLLALGTRCTILVPGTHDQFSAEIDAPRRSARKPVRPVTLALGRTLGYDRGAPRRRTREILSGAMLSRPIETSVVPTLRDAMRQLAGGVAIVSVGEGDRRAGFTASSLTSLTLDPPCILVCVNRTVSAWPLIRDTRRFCVNILADRHAPLAVRFSGVDGIKGAARFDMGDWLAGENGTPVLADALAAIECDLEEAVERHSHMILIGAVRSLMVEASGQPLLYGEGEYGRFTPL